MECMECMECMGCTTSTLFCANLPAMAITPLYTLAELDSEIAQAKQDLSSARRALDRQITTGGGSSRRVQQDTIANLQRHLEWLQQQRTTLQVGAGYQSIVGRPAR